MTMTAAFIARLASTDRALLQRSMTRTDSRARLFWTFVTHIGGLRASMAAALPVISGGRIGAAARDGILILVVSHLLVQLVKRSVGRPRPAAEGALKALVLEPDRFSFPSGHSAAVMSFAVAYAIQFPVFAAPLILVAMLVGASRVCLGVHYPGDVVAGQILAVLTACAVLNV